MEGIHDMVRTGEVGVIFHCTTQRAVDALLRINVAPTKIKLNGVLIDLQLIAQAGA